MTTLHCRDLVLQLTDTPALMGILNVTPDSFSDGGLFLDPARAADHALRMLADGAAIIDIGGESTRPGSEPVPPDEQIRRTVPVIQAITRRTKTIISIDTTSANVAKTALDAGARIINDISALRLDPRMAPLAAQTHTPVILMHMQGAPRSMQTNPTYLDVVQEVKQFLADRIDFAVGSGINHNQIIIDPGLGFGKSLQHNLLLLKHLDAFHTLGVPLLVGTSRKSFIGKILGIDTPADRLFGTAATVAWAVAAGAQILRVHDVKDMSHVARLTAAIRNQP